MFIDEFVMPGLSVKLHFSKDEIALLDKALQHFVRSPKEYKILSETNKEKFGKLNQSIYAVKVLTEDML